MNDIPYRFENNPVVICQCIPPCLLPFREGEGEDAEWSPVGCLRPRGHEGGCSLEGWGQFTYREVSESNGPRVVLRWDADNLVQRGECFRCHREYELLYSSQVAYGTCGRCKQDEQQLIAGLCDECAPTLHEERVPVS